MAQAKYFPTINLINCRNLPKADLIGKIDPYVKINITGVGVLKSSTKKVTYDPDYNESIFCPVSVPDGTQIVLEIWDADAVGKDERVGTVTVTMRPGVARYDNVEILLKKGMKGHKGTSMITFEVTAFRDSMSVMNFVRGGVTADPKSVSFLPEGYNKDVLIKLEYEGGKIDVKAFCLNPQKYISIGYFMPNFEYKIKFERFRDGKRKVGDFVVYSEAKLDDIPSGFRLDLVKIYVADFKFIEQKALEDITVAHGWKSALTYEAAKTSLSDVYCDDSSKSIYFFTNNFAAKCDWDSNNADYSVHLFDHAQKESMVVEISTQVKNKQTHTYFAKAKPLNKHLVTMKSAVDDIEYGTPNTDFAIDLIQLSNVHMLTLTDICPLYA